MTAEEKRLFRNRKAVPEQLLEFGFREVGDGFRYETDILDGQFRMTVFAADREVAAGLVDRDSGEDYVLHQVPGAAGTFVGAVREAHEAVLREIAAHCFVPDVFRSDCTKTLLEYVRKTYGDELEYPWPKTLENAVLRRQDTGKWYGALLIVSRRKLGLDSDEPVEILDLRIPTEEVESTVDGIGYFPGFHMNKRHWYTILLDGTVPPEEIFPQIDRSRRMAMKKSKTPVP